MTPTRESIAAEVRAQMGRAKITGRQLANMTGLNQSNLRKRLAGEVDFGAIELWLISRALDVPLQIFLGVEPVLADA